MMNYHHNFYNSCFNVTFFTYKNYSTCKIKQCVSIFTNVNSYTTLGHAAPQINGVVSSRIFTTWTSSGLGSNQGIILLLNMDRPRHICEIECYIRKRMVKNEYCAYLGVNYMGFWYFQRCDVCELWEMGGSGLEMVGDRRRYVQAHWGRGGSITLHCCTPWDRVQDKAHCTGEGAGRSPMLYHTTSLNRHRHHHRHRQQL